MGHRGLKIIDVDDRAAQPFLRDHAIVLFNIELYNYLELRAGLRLLGAGFVKESGTEVIAAGVQHRGTDCFSRFDGMFAVRIIDYHRGRIVTPPRPIWGETYKSELVRCFLHVGFAPAPMTVWEGRETGGRRDSWIRSAIGHLVFKRGIGPDTARHREDEGFFQRDGIRSATHHVRHAKTVRHVPRCTFPHGP